MQKLTIFSVLLSLSVLLLMSDLVFHDYLKADTFIKGSSGVAPTEILTEESELTQEESITDEEIVEETPDELIILEARLTAELFESVGFVDPVLKEAIFTGSLFQFLSFADQTDAFIHQWNLFEGETFVGGVYEINYPTETGAFQGYLTLRDRASGLSNLGTVNESNGYGDASFYFNHKVKTKTIHLVIKKGQTVYAFDYDQVHHPEMKALFALLP